MHSGPSVYKSTRRNHGLLYGGSGVHAQRRVQRSRRCQKKKHEHYNNHKRKCIDEGNTDSRLDVELIPLALEATGAAGHEVEELGEDLKHAYKTRVLPISSASAAAAFNDAWVYRPDIDHLPKRHG